MAEKLIYHHQIGTYQKWALQVQKDRTCQGGPGLTSLPQEFELLRKQHAIIIKRQQD